MTGLRGRSTLLAEAFWVAATMDHVMSTEMLRRLKLLVETYDERVDRQEVNRHQAPHQRDAWKPAAEATG